jgi:hypothetical protein
MARQASGRNRPLDMSVLPFPTIADTQRPSHQALTLSEAIRAGPISNFNPLSPAVGAACAQMAPGRCCADKEVKSILGCQQTGLTQCELG